MWLDSPVQQETGRILVTLLPWGWGGKLWSTTGCCTEVVPVCSSWQIMQCLLSNVLLKRFSRCMYWVRFSEPRVGFEAERTPFPGHQCMCQCDFQELDMPVFWKWWLRCSVLVSWDLKGNFLLFWTSPCQSNRISRCTLGACSDSAYRNGLIWCACVSSFSGTIKTKEIAGVFHLM